VTWKNSIHYVGNSHLLSLLESALNSNFFFLIVWKHGAILLWWFCHSVCLSVRVSVCPSVCRIYELYQDSWTYQSVVIGHSCTKVLPKILIRISRRPTKEIVEAKVFILRKIRGANAELRSRQQKLPRGRPRGKAIASRIHHCLLLNCAYVFN